MQITRVGVDLAKHVFQVHGVDRSGRCVWKRQLRSSSWLGVLSEKLESGCEIGMEACGGAHHWARALRERGYRVKLIAPQFVKPYLKSSKNDVRDAEAICEAMSRPGMRFVPIKTLEQQDVQALHRVRSSLIGQRTAQANQIRGLVAEYGLVAPKQLAPLRRAIPEWLEDASNKLSGRFRYLLSCLQEELLRVDSRLKELDREIEQLASSLPDARRLQQLHGVGPLVATALVAHFGDARHFTRGRDAAASLGLTPRHHGTGGKNRLLGITKRGDPYLRSILIHGARSVVSSIGRCSKRERITNRGSLWLKRARPTQNEQEEPQSRLHSKSIDGEQVGPAPANPDSGPVR